MYARKWPLPLCVYSVVGPSSIKRCLLCTLCISKQTMHFIIKCTQANYVWAERLRKTALVWGRKFLMYYREPDFAIQLYPTLKDISSIFYIYILSEKNGGKVSRCSSVQIFFWNGKYFCISIDGGLAAVSLGFSSVGFCGWKCLRVWAPAPDTRGRILGHNWEKSWKFSSLFFKATHLY